MSVGKSEVERPAVRSLDASALKAYAHPLRLEIIRLLTDHGAATATTLAQRLNESTGQTSYHLRQLAKHGLVVEDVARGTGRERWWRPASFQVDAASMRSDPGLRPATAALLHAMVENRAQTLQQWIDSSDEIPTDWVDSSLHSQMTLRLTVEELAELNEAVQAVLEKYTDRSRARETTPVDGARRVRAYYDAFPLADGAGGLPEG